MARSDAEADLKINVDVDTRRAGQGLDKAAQQVHGFAGHVKTLTAGILGADALKGAATAVWDFGKKAVQAYGKSEQNAVMYTDAMKRIPGASDQATKSLMDQAAALGEVTVYGKGATKQGQAVLASFGLTADQIKTLTPLMQDYATKTGQDLPAAAKQLGRALMGQGRALKNVGIDFKDTGSLQGNFDQLTNELTTHVGGLSVAMGTTAAGQMEIMKNKIKMLTVAFGKWLYPAVSKTIEILLELVGWLQKNSAWLVPLVGTVVAFAGAFLVLASAIKIAAAAKKAFAAVKMFAAANPFVLIIAGAVALIVLLYQLYQHWDWFHKAVDAIWQALQVAWDATVGAIVVAAQWLWQGIQLVFDKILAIVTPFVMWFTLPWRIAWQLIKGFMDDGWSGVWAVFKSIPGQIASALAGVFNVIITPFKLAWRFIEGLFPSLWSWFSSIPGKIAGFLGGIFDVITAPFRNAFDAVKNIVGSAVDWVTGKIDAMKGIVNGALDWAKGVYNAFARGWNAIEVKMPEIDTHIPGIGKVGGFTLGLPDLPMLQTGAFVSKMGTAIIGDAGPEWVLPDAKLRQLLADFGGAGAGRRAPLVNIESATFGDEVSVDVLLRRAAWTMRTQGV
jgi:hypothetical protein